MYGVVFTLFAVRQGLTLAKPTGGIVAIGLGLAALAWLAVRPDKPTPATAAAMTATPVVMAFHRVITAELACLIGPVFLAMYLRAFYSPRRGLILVAVLTGASVFALAVEPVPTIDYVVLVVAIVGAAESFGLVTRALVTVACADPLQAYSTAPAGRSRQSICWRDRVRAQPPSPSSHWTSTTSNSSTTSRDTSRGDQHLVGCAKRWRELTPANAVLARLGGDEFAVSITERTGSTPTAAELFVDGVRLHTPATSIGTAVHSGDAADPTDVAALYASADASLYAAKRERSR